jgi:hypothetical protein
MHHVRDGRRLQQAHTPLYASSPSDNFKGNYWTATLFFKARNGTYKRVPQRAQQGIDSTNGGMVPPPHPYLPSSH